MNTRYPRSVLGFVLALTGCGGLVERDPRSEIELDAQVEYLCGGPRAVLEVDYRNSGTMPKSWHVEPALFETSGRKPCPLPVEPADTGFVPPGQAVSLVHESGFFPKCVHSDECFGVCDDDNSWKLHVTWQSSEGTTEQRTISGTHECK
jgi:hypothetical protein